MKDPVIHYPKTLLLLTILAVTVIRIGGASDLYQNLDQTKTLAFTADMAVNQRFILPRDSWGEVTRKPPLVNWVEKGQAPAQIVASVRGAGNAGGANEELPAGWSATRTRPLCPHPQTASYDGKGDPETASSFACR